MPGTPDTPLPETIIAFDFGLRRIGVAVGQRVTGSASPLGVVANSPDGPDWAHIEALLAEWRPETLVVGMPLHADGSPSPIAPALAEFVHGLVRFALPVETVDERYSSIEARQMLLEGRRAGRTRRRTARESVDAAAAVLIAERWLGRAG